VFLSGISLGEGRRITVLVDLNGNVL
jgi:hypothetical protein